MSEFESPEIQQDDSSVDESQQQVSDSTEQQDLLDLDSVEKFRFADKEWTPKEFRSAYMMQSDYTKKTQEIAQERKFAENLSIDIKAVLSKPELADKFKEIYPEKYHAVLDQLLENVSNSKQQGVPAQQENESNSDFAKRLEQVEKRFHEQEVEAASAQIDATFSKLSEQYPMADEEVVITRAQALIEKGTKVDDRVFNELFKQSHDRNKERLEKHYSKQVGKQKEANAKGKDMASGGGIMGRAPVKPKTLKEAHELVLAEAFNN